MAYRQKKFDLSLGSNFYMKNEEKVIESQENKEKNRNLTDLYGDFSTTIIYFVWKNNKMNKS